jgi:chemotaxis protein methyltransferase CheR
MTALDELTELLARRTGFVLSPSRGPDAESAIRRAMTKAGVADVERYRAMLETGALSLDDAIAELVIGETYFMREPDQFSVIRGEILPEIAARKQMIRCWSAGCATGEEPYSLAIALDELGLADRADVRGTDISQAALARARRGVYGSWALRTAEPAFVERWFRRDGKQFVLADDVRKRVRFTALNLAHDDYPSATTGIGVEDLILCRNVLLYFDRPTIEQVAQRLYASLADGGWLVCGSSDPPLAGCAPLSPVVTKHGVFYRRLAALPAAEPVDAPTDHLAEARKALRANTPDEAVGLLRGRLDPDAWLVRLRARAASAGSPAAAAESAQAVLGHPLSVELHHLRAMLLIDAGRLDDALASIRRVLYLDRSLAVPHWALGTVLENTGDLAGAARAYRNAADLAAAHERDELLPLANGGTAGQLVDAARRALERVTR